MQRFTYKEPNGTWGVHGEEFRNMSETMYGAMYKLLDYEETGLNPDAVERLKDAADEIHIGSEIQGYEVYGIYKNVCIAYNRHTHAYVVWLIDTDKHGVHCGSYYDDKLDAECHFVELAFSDWSVYRWTDCSEQLPPEPEAGLECIEEYPEYLVIVKHFDTSTVMRYLGSGEWSDEEGNLYNVESWMPMPKGE